jgi:hypothetical protein
VDRKIGVLILAKSSEQSRQISGHAKNRSAKKTRVSTMAASQKTRRLICIAISVAGLLFSRHYSGPAAEILHSHGANVTFSFGMYFILGLCKLPLIERKSINAAYALLGVSVQEGAQALNLYPGVFDPLDFLANAVGICAAWMIDVWMSKTSSSAIPPEVTD